MSDLGISTAKLVKDARFPVFYEMAVDDGEVLFQEDTKLLKLLIKDNRRGALNSIKKMDKAITMMKMNLKAINKKATVINQSN